MSSLGKRRVAALKQDDLAYTARRREIIDCAALLFRSNGYAATTFKDIAAKLHTDRATIYYYFASKRDLLLDVVRDAVVSVSVSAQQISNSTDTPTIKLQNIIASLLNSYAKNYPHQFLYIQEGMAVNKEQDEQLYQLGKDMSKALPKSLKTGWPMARFLAVKILKLSFMDF